jgi:N-acetylmuramoyl-L-alanine amidase
MKSFAQRILAAILMSVFILTLAGSLVGAAVTYTAQYGDSLFIIAQKFGVTVANIKSANGLTSDSIYTGQHLVIPTGSVGGSRYTVIKGDTLFLIAKRFGVTVDSIRKANNYWKDVVYPGQVLIIPESRSTVNVSRSFSRSDLDLLAKVVYAEARGESYEGQVAVAAVVLNRVKNPNFPNSIPGVIYEPGAFTCIYDGQINLVPDQMAYNAMKDALNGWDPSNGALFYWNPVTAQNKWVWSRTITTQIGNHVFAK